MSGKVQEIIRPHQRCQLTDIEDLIPLMQRDNPLEEPYHEQRDVSGSCSCPSCSRACKSIPGFFDPLGFIYYIISKIDGEYDYDAFVRQFESELHTLQMDFYFNGGNTDKIYMLRPATLDEEPGKLVRMDPIKSDCVFLTSSGCQLNERQRPLECRTAYGCGKETFLGGKGVVKDHWNAPLGKAIIALYTKLGIAKYGRSFQKRASDDFRGEMMAAMERRRTIDKGADPKKLVKEIAKIRFEETGMVQTQSDIEKIQTDLITDQMRIFQQSMGGGMREKTNDPASF